MQRVDFRQDVVEEVFQGVRPVLQGVDVVGGRNEEARLQALADFVRIAIRPRALPRPVIGGTLGLHHQRMQARRQRDRFGNLDRHDDGAGLAQHVEAR